MLPTATPLPSSSSLAIDAQALSSLKRQAKDAPREATRQAATQFEALFMNMLLKGMREALPGSDPLNSESAKTYTGMLDTQLSQKLAEKGNGLGLADMIVKHLERSQNKLRAPDTATAAPGTTPAASPSTAASGPRDFVTRMRVQAQEAARSLGVPADFIVGQAALETGWGKHEIKGADGTNSRNLFGIKAGGNWQGKSVSVMTTEYINGAPRTMVEKFRAYDSYADAFRDYAKLIGGSARYVAATQAGQDASVFAQRLAAGGYATDPRYAEKLTRVIQHTQQLRANA